MSLMVIAADGTPGRPDIEIRGHRNIYWLDYYRCCANSRAHVMAQFDGMERWVFLTDEGAIESRIGWEQHGGIHYGAVVGRAQCAENPGVARVLQADHVWYDWHFADECSERGC